MLLTGGTVSLPVFLLEYQTSPLNATSVFSDVPLITVPHLAVGVQEEIQM